MIITKKKSPEEIAESLKGFKNIYLFGCNACAEQCRTGGIQELKEMAGFLKERGFNVCGSALVDETCYRQLVLKALKQDDATQRADAFLVLSCGAGVRTVSNCVPEEVPVMPALDTLFLASVERVGRFFEGCSLCGDCVLHRTAAVCPHTECPKGLLNGPCGGMHDGMCEVNPEEECAWAQIYRRLKIQGRIKIMKEYAPPKDNSLKAKPARLLLR